MAHRTVTTPAWPARHQGPAVGLPALVEVPAGLDLGRAAHPPAVRQLGRHGLPRHAGGRRRAGSIRGRRATWPSSAACRRRRGPTGRSRIAKRLGMPLKMAAKVDSGRRRLLPRSHRAAAGRSADRVHRRDRRRAEAGLPRRRGGAAVPDRLARAVRPGDDRGDGLRHAGGRLRLRLGARGGRRRRHRLHRERRGRGGGRGRARSTSSTGARCAAASTGASRPPRWRAVTSTSTPTVWPACRSPKSSSPSQKMWTEASRALTSLAQIA